MPHVSQSRFRVRYAETDQMGVVYYANYLVWMEIGRTDYCRDCGFNYRDMETEAKVFIAVAEATCRYMSPARYDDEITVETRMERVSPRVLEFAYRIRCGEKMIAEGSTVHVAIGPDGKPKRLTDHYLGLLQRNEAG